MSVQDAVSDAVSGVANESAEVKAAVGAAAATAAIPTPPPPVVGTLWMILIAGLVLAVLGSLVGVVWVVVDGKEATDPDVIVTIFTTTLAGLLGLFVKSPTSGGQGTWSLEGAFGGSPSLSNFENGQWSAWRMLTGTSLGRGSSEGARDTLDGYDGQQSAASVGIMIAVVAAYATAIGFTVLTVTRVRRSSAEDTRSYDDLFDDVRAMNQNNSYFVAAIVILLGLAVEGRLLSDDALILLLMGFLAGSVAIFFYPVRKADPKEMPSQARALWLFKIVATQWTVIFTVFGISVVVIERLAT